jgi:light-regulated signal transduction histidine kinase (bacteriophytochrome)
MGFVVVVNSIRVYKNKNRMLALENKRKTNIIFDQLKAITKRNAMLEEIATKYSHDIRGHVATILGLSQLVDKDNYTSPQNEKIVEGIIETTEKLDGIIKQVVAEENKLIRDKE